MGLGPTGAALGWSRDCPLSSSHDRERRGISLLEETFSESPWQVDYAVPCPENLRRAERKKYTPRLNVASGDFEAGKNRAKPSKKTSNSHGFAWIFDDFPMVFRCGLMPRTCISPSISTSGPM